MSDFDTGEDFASIAHPYSSDLDIFGHHSLWQVLSRANTRYGRETLAGWLLGAGTTEAIRDRQEASAELGEMIDWRESFQATGVLGKHPGVSLDDMQQWLKEKPYFGARTWLQIYRFIGPVLLLAPLVLGLMDIISLWFSLGALVANGLVNRYYRDHGNQVFKHVEEKAKFLGSFGRLIRQIEELEVQHYALKTQQDRLKTQGKPAHLQWCYWLSAP